MVKVSVIIPVYNAGDFIRKSSSCVLNQTLKDVELLLVDDGSKQETASICDEIAAEDSRVKVFHKQNGGISSARNFGIGKAGGEFIAFIDQDDTVSLDMYEKLYQAAGEKNDVVISDFDLIYPDKTTVYHTWEIHENYDDTYKDMLLHGYGGNIWNMIIRKSLVEKYDVRFPEHLRHCEDVYFAYRLLLHTDMVAKVHEVFYHYNLSNPNQVSNNLDERFNACARQHLDEITDYMKSMGVYDKFQKEILWLALQTKTDFVLNPDKYDLFNSWRPEANKEILRCPLLGWKMKLMMLIISKHCYKAASLMCRIAI